MEYQAYAVVGADGQQRTVLTSLFHEKHSRSSFIQMLDEEMREVYGPSISKTLSFSYLGIADVHSDLRLAA